MNHALMVVFSLFLVRCVSNSALNDESVLETREVGNNRAPIELIDSGPGFPQDRAWHDKAVFSHPLVMRWRQYFAEQDQERFRRYLARGQIYKSHVEKVLSEYGVPKSIYYLAIIESGFNTSALSHAKAVGPWQFMPATGKRFGLAIDPYVDERRDPVRSTRAAAQYLKSLYSVFQSWYLAMAAYNSGESRVMNAIIAHGTRDYWTLVAKKALPQETMHYVPKFLAALWVGEQGRVYNQDREEFHSDFEVSPANVPPFVPLSEIASLLGLSISAIKFYNPHLLRSHTPSTSYRLWLPINHSKGFDGLAGLKSDSSLATIAATQIPYTVKRGDTLAKLARRFKTTSREIKRENKLVRNQLKPGQELLITKAEKMRRYRVKRGDSLQFLAQRFGVTVQHIKTNNALVDSRLVPGQILRIKM